MLKIPFWNIYVKVEDNTNLLDAKRKQVDAVFNELNKSLKKISVRQDRNNLSGNRCVFVRLQPQKYLAIAVNVLGKHNPYLFFYDDSEKKSINIIPYELFVKLANKTLQNVFHYKVTNIDNPEFQSLLTETISEAIMDISEHYDQNNNEVHILDWHNENSPEEGLGN